MPNLFLPVLTAFLISFITTPVVIKLAFFLGLIDNPKTSVHPAALHKKPVARAGGIPIFLAILTAAIIFLPLDKKLTGILLASAVIVLVGTIDDRYQISPYIRFVAHFLAAGIVVASGVGIAYVTNPLGGIIYLDQPRIIFDFFGSHQIWVLADILALIWIVWVINAFNWSWGVDGQGSGIVIITTVTIAILSLRFAQAGDGSQWNVVRLSLITAGATLGFLIYNWYPRKILPGDGAMVLGLMLAVLPILSGAKLATALLVLAVPTIDAVFAIVRRLSRHQSPFQGDREHLHHLLLNLGWGHRRIALFYWFICVILGAIALNIDSEGKLFAFLMIVVILGGAIFWLKYLSPFSNPPGQGNGSKT